MVHRSSSEQSDYKQEFVKEEEKAGRITQVKRVVLEVEA